MTRKSRRIQKSLQKNRAKRRANRLVLLVFLLVLLMPIRCQVIAQEFDPVRAIALIQQLDSNNLAKRNEAESKLVELGSPLTDWLEDARTRLPVSSEVEFRMQRISETIFRNSIEVWSKPTAIRLVGGLQDVSNVMSGTGNQVEFPSTALPTFPESKVGVVTFWEAIELLCTNNDLAIDFGTSGKPVVTLAAVSDELKLAKLAANQGLVRVEWIENAQHDQPVQVRMRIAWEPRLDVISLGIPMAKVQLTDSQNRDWAQFNQEATYTIPAPVDKNFTSIRLPVRPVNEDGGEKAGPLERVVFLVEMKILAPTARCRFEKFAAPNGVNPQPLPQTFGMATVSLESVHADSQEIRVLLTTRYASKQMTEPLQSHTDWSRFCNAELVLDDGQTIQPTQQKQVRQQPYLYSIEYSFPAVTTTGTKTEDADLIFRTPSGIIQVEQEVTLGLR